MAELKVYVDEILSDAVLVRDEKDGTEKFAIVVESDGVQVVLVMTEDIALHLSNVIWHGNFNK